MFQFDEKVTLSIIKKEKFKDTVLCNRNRKTKSAIIQHEVAKFSEFFFSKANHVDKTNEQNCIRLLILHQ